MKSILRMNGQETVVEGVVPVSDEFNNMVFNEIQKIAKGMVEMVPLAPFGIPEDKCEGYIAYTLNGKFDGEVPFKITVTNVEQSSDVVLNAFVVFRK